MTTSIKHILFPREHFSIKIFSRNPNFTMHHVNLIASTLLVFKLHSLHLNMHLEFVTTPTRNYLRRLLARNKALKDLTIDLLLSRPSSSENLLSYLSTKLHQLHLEKFSLRARRNIYSEMLALNLDPLNIELAALNPLDLKAFAFEFQFPILNSDLFLGKIKNFKAMTHLELGLHKCEQLDGGIMRQTLCDLVNLQSLKLSLRRLAWNSKEFLEFLKEIPLSLKLERLKVDLGETKLNDDCIIALSQKMCQLQNLITLSLVFDNVFVSNRSLIELGKVLRVLLGIREFSCNLSKPCKLITSEGLNQLVLKESKNAKGITNYGLDLDTSGLIDFLFLNCLISSLKSFESLKVLSLTMNQIGCLGFCQVCEAMGELKELEILKLATKKEEDFSDYTTNVQNKGNLSKSFSQCQKLRVIELNFKFKSVQEEFLIDIAIALMKLNSVEKLSLQLKGIVIKGEGLRWINQKLMKEPEFCRKVKELSVRIDKMESESIVTEPRNDERIQILNKANKFKSTEENEVADEESINFTEDEETKSNSEMKNDSNTAAEMSTINKVNQSSQTIEVNQSHEKNRMRHEGQHLGAVLAKFKILRKLELGTSTWGSAEHFLSRGSHLLESIVRMRFLKEFVMRIPHENEQRDEVPVVDTRFSQRRDLRMLIYHTNN